MLRDDNSALHAYLADVARSTPLSRQRETDLSAHARQGDTVARNELAHANLRFVVDVATQFQHRGLPLCELIGAGNLGLVTAAERFDGTRGLKFISYAVWWIRQSIRLALAEQVRTVRLSPRQRELLRGIAVASQRLAQKQAREPHDDEIAAEMGVTTDAVAAARLHGRAVYSLDAPLRGGDADGRLLQDTLVDPEQEPPDAEVLRESAIAQLRLRLKALDQRELRILHLHYGLDGGEGLTLDQIGAVVRLTRERVRQIKNEALDKLRRPPRGAARRSVAGEGPLPPLQRADAAVPRVV